MIGPIWTFARSQPDHALPAPDGYWRSRQDTKAASFAASEPGLGVTRQLVALTGKKSESSAGAKPSQLL